MKPLLPLVFLLFLSCNFIDDIKINDVKEISSSCSITLIDGSTVQGLDVKILKSTRTLTYRDSDSKLWSLFEEDYTSYSCGN